MPDIVSIGECFIEFFTYETLHAEAEWELVHSGDTYNVLAMANGLGTSCGYVTRVSDDPFGDYLLEEWRKRGIDTTHVRAGAGLQRGGVLVVRAGRRGIEGRLPQGRRREHHDTRRHRPRLYLRRQILHVSGISQGISGSCRETVMKAVKIAHESGVLVSYDTNLRVNLWESMAEARDAMDELLPYIDIITPSFPHEPAALIDLHTEREVIDWFLERGVGTVGLKCGAEGAWVGTPREIVRIPGVAPRGLLHTSGAGDTFVGGLLHCIANGMDAVEGARWGVACAGLKVGGPSIEAQPTLQEVLEVLPSVQAINVSR